MRFAPIEFGQLSPYQQFIFMGGNDFLYSNLNLDNNSTVVVLGGFRGNSALEFNRRYHCKVLFYEPYIEYLLDAQQRLVEFPTIEYRNVGVSGTSGELLLYLEEDASSQYQTKSEVHPEKCESISVEMFEKEIGNKVTLIEFNAEGAEFEILPKLLENENTLIQTILVQFHKVDKDSDAKMMAIHELLHQKGYILVYSFRYVWERWELNSSPIEAREKIRSEICEALHADLICIERRYDKYGKGEQE